MSPSTEIVAHDSNSDPLARRAKNVLRLLTPHRQYNNAMAAFDRFDELAVTETLQNQTGASANAPFSFKGGEDHDDEDDANTSCLMIIGLSGTGKTGILRSIRDKPALAKVLGGQDGDIWPVVTITVPDNPTPKELVRALCASVNAPAPKDWTMGQVSRSLIFLFEGLQTRYIEMDEAQVFVENLTPKQVSQNARFLKFLLVSIGVPIVLAGEPPLEKLLEYGALRRRTQNVIRMGPYVWGLQSEVTEFIAIASTLATELGFAEAEGVRDPKNAMRFYYDTRGVIGLMAKRLIEAAYLAKEEGSEALEIRHLSGAWLNWERQSAIVAEDPFMVTNESADLKGQNPYCAEAAEFKELWRLRFHPPATPMESGRQTNRHSNRSNKERSFGR